MSGKRKNIPSQEKAVLGDGVCVCNRASVQELGSHFWADEVIRDSGR